MEAEGKEALVRKEGISQGQGRGWVWVQVGGHSEFFRCPETGPEGARKIRVETEGYFRKVPTMKSMGGDQSRREWERRFLG